MLRKKFHDFPTKAYNLEVTDIELVKQDIVNFIKSAEKPLAGLTLVAGNVHNSLKMAEWLKSIGCDVVVGGPEITELTTKYYANLPIIDGAVVGPAENILPQIIAEGLQSSIINLSTKKFSADIKYLPCDFENAVIDYGLLFRIEDHGGVSFLWSGDCPFANNRCFFCGRQRKGYGCRNPKIVWEEIKQAYNLGKRKYYNTADTVATSADNFHQFVLAKPDDIRDINMKCFVNAFQVNDKISDDFKKLESWPTIGIESLTRIQASEKGQTNIEDNYRALKVLAKHNLQMILTFVIGLPGETQDSLLADSNELINIVKKYKDNIYMITVSPLVVINGSKAFDKTFSVLKGKLPKKHDDEFYNPLLLSELYFKKFTEITIDDAIRQICILERKVAEINPKIGFDSKGLDSEKYFRIKKDLNLKLVNS
ncbi:MAG: hypothetical protein A2V69_02390 [Candidatus Portnoybacteria bacterium RBG_13_40_8]|uniref:B12-binding domain-containing protein n=1 Tax=Candidatus Portnoybacteria bacterium RBG_13_40_8 TaxID=1801990 RepID=A0A1G2F2X8_9BACT|nr:MAG: hypothetical protein A2V69_02390 [Candidatus Portnoybacteria bacterium RBG_13_40_8]